MGREVANRPRDIERKPTHIVCEGSYLCQMPEEYEFVIKDIGSIEKYAVGLLDQFNQCEQCTARIIKELMYRRETSKARDILPERVITFGLDKLLLSRDINSRARAQLWVAVTNLRKSGMKVIGTSDVINYMCSNNPDFF